MSSLAAAPWFVLDLKETCSTVFPLDSNKCLPPIPTIIMLFMGNSLEGDKGEGRGRGEGQEGYTVTDAAGWSAMGQLIWGTTW